MWIRRKKYKKLINDLIDSQQDCGRLKEMLTKKEFQFQNSQETMFFYRKKWEKESLVLHLHKQQSWSLQTFGPGDRTKGVIEHIKEEIKEIEKDPKSLEERIDLMLLAFDGAYRQGYSPTQILDTLKEKLEKNMNREWPDWRKHKDVPIHHIKKCERKSFYNIKEGKVSKGGKNTPPKTKRPEEAPKGQQPSMDHIHNDDSNIINSATDIVIASEVMGITDFF